MIERKFSPRWCVVLYGLLAVLSCAPAARADELMRQVQEELRKRHLYFGDIDGRFTPEVAAALRRYQQTKGFPPDGTADEVTLRSLTLLPPAPASHTLSPLPDITVLRSDEGLAQDRPAGTPPAASVKSNKPPAIVALPATPAPASVPPPPAAVPVRQPSVPAVCAFIVAYLQAGQTNDPEAELRFYASHVDYFEDGWVDQRFLVQDVAKYDHRWPQRQFAVFGPVEVTPAVDGEPLKTAVHFRYRWAVKNNRYSLVGQTDSAYVLAGSGPEDLRIVSIKEQRVRP